MLNPDLVRLAAHYRFSPCTTERQDPESKGKVEALVRFTKSDLIPYEGFASLDEANRAARRGVAKVNAEVHYETRARPAERLAVELPLLRALPAGSDPLHLRRFCRIALTDRSPDESTLRKLVKRLGPDHRADHAPVIAAATGPGAGRRSQVRAARIDSTVVEADIRYPTNFGSA